MDGTYWVCFCCRHSPVSDVNVRIFGVRAVECMSAQTRPRFILSSERVRTHISSKGKFQSTGKILHRVSDGFPQYSLPPPPPPLPSAFGLVSDRPEVRIPLERDFSGWSHTSDLEISTPVATLPGAWCLGSVLGLVDPVSVYTHWVRYKV